MWWIHQKRAPDRLYCEVIHLHQFLPHFATTIDDDDDGCVRGRTRDWCVALRCVGARRASPSMSRARARTRCMWCLDCAAPRWYDGTRARVVVAVVSSRTRSRVCACVVSRARALKAAFAGEDAS